MNNIKYLRKKKDLTQAQLAEAFDIDTTTVSKWESGDSMPRADKLPELARILGCKIDDLFGDTAQTKEG